MSEQPQASPTVPTSGTDISAALMQSAAGTLAVGAIGLGVLVVGGYHVWSGITEKFLDNLRGLPGGRAGHGVRLASPREASRRGAHVSLAHPQAWQLTQALLDRGVVPDFRTPDRLRLGPAPLYTRYVDVWDAVDRLVTVLDTGAQDAYPTERSRVT